MAIDWDITLDSVKKRIAEVDQSFSSVDTDSFWHELTALHMAIFALAFTLMVKLKLDYMVRGVHFTKHVAVVRVKLITIAC